MLLVTKKAVFMRLVAFRKRLKRHVLKEGKKAMTKNVITYTNDALELWNNSNGMGKLMSSGSLRLKGAGVGGFYSLSGLIRSFFYQ